MLFNRASGIGATLKQGVHDAVRVALLAGAGQEGENLFNRPGQGGNRWVDEDSPCEPQREGGIACWEAERLLLGSPPSLCFTTSVVLLRPPTLLIPATGLVCPSNFTRNLKFLYGSNLVGLTLN